MRYLLAAFLAFFGFLNGSAQTAAGVDGTWTAELRNAVVYLQMRTARPPDSSERGWDGDWSVGQRVAVDDLSGLPLGDERLTLQQATFELHREAGTLAFQGAFRDGRGAGLFTFVPRPEFATEMKAIGYADDLPLWRQFQLAVHDVGPKYIEPDPIPWTV